MDNGSGGLLYNTVLLIVFLKREFCFLDIISPISGSHMLIPLFLSSLSPSFLVDINTSTDVRYNRRNKVDNRRRLINKIENF